MKRLAREFDVDAFFFPYYGVPVVSIGRYKVVSVIHDLQAIHFPENFSKGQLFSFWLQRRNCIRVSDLILTDSEYSKADIVQHFSLPDGGVRRLYLPVKAPAINSGTSSDVLDRFGLNERGYYYTVSKMRPNKNLATLIRVFAGIRDRGIEGIPDRLVISGVDGGRANEIQRLIGEYGVEQCVKLTGFVTDAERDALTYSARAFLFPSIFEGFGLPPIEAMAMGVPVITTRESCLYEVTQGKANYVDEPLSIDAWISTMIGAHENLAGFDLDAFSGIKIAGELLNAMASV